MVIECGSEAHLIKLQGFQGFQVKKKKVIHTIWSNWSKQTYKLENNNFSVTLQSQFPEVTTTTNLGY